MSKREKEKKATFDLPRPLARDLLLRAAEYGITQKFIVLRSVKAFLTSNVRADDYAKKLFFGFHLSDDPEDRLEIPMTVEELKILHAEVHASLRKVGENPDECKA